jgi:hypothetical protein
MRQLVQKLIFTFYEQRYLRNWFYTLAFAIFVPTGFRFAILAWEYGDWFDKPLSILAGLLIGITATVTLLRIWTVPPTQTVGADAGGKTMQSAGSSSSVSQMFEAARQQAAHNHEIARGAAALGSTRQWTFKQ